MGELWYAGTCLGQGLGPVDSSIGQSLHEALKCSFRAAQVYWGYKITFTGVRPKMAQPKDVPLVDRSKLVLDLESACFLVKAVTALQGRWEGCKCPNSPSINSLPGRCVASPVACCCAVVSILAPRDLVRCCAVLTLSSTPQHIGDESIL